MDSPKPNVVGVLFIRNVALCFDTPSIARQTKFESRDRREGISLRYNDNTLKA